MKEKYWILIRILLYALIILCLFNGKNYFIDRTYQIKYDDLYFMAFGTFFGILFLFSVQYFFNKVYKRKWMWPTWKKCPFNPKELLQSFCFIGEINILAGLTYIISTGKFKPFFLGFIILGISLIVAVYLFGVFLNFITKINQHKKEIANDLTKAESE